MKKFAFLLWLFCTVYTNAQVGVNTTDPKAQLDIRSTNQATPSNTDGMLIPKMDAFPITNPTVDQQGMLVYLTTTVGANTPGFYYWNNPTVAWIPVGNNNNSDWKLTGNSGTNSSTNFIGTTDNQDIVFKRNNILSGMLGTQNTAIGLNALLSNTAGIQNTANGVVALQDNTSGNSNTAHGFAALLSNTTGNNNTANGVSALRNNTMGFNNTANGVSALQDNTTGASNTANGAFALFSNTIGNQNTANGISAIRMNTTGINNTANGFSALQKTTTGSTNTASGAFALFSNTIGTENTASGVSALVNTTTGIRNTAYGRASLLSNTTGDENTALGALSDVATNILTNATAIGARAEVGASNSLVLGSINGINGATADVNVGIGTRTPLDRLHVVGNIRMEDGNQAPGMILASDLNGRASWTNVSAANGWGLIGNAGTNSLTNFIGTTDNQSFVLKTNNLQRALFTNSGKTIFGNDIPLTDNWFNFSKVLVGTNDSDNDLTLRSSGTDIPAINILRSNGTMTSPTVLSSGEAGSIRFWRYSGVGGFDGYNAAGRIISNVTASGTSLNLSGGIATAMVIEDSGSIGIGVANPTERLEVAGKSLFTNGFSADNAALIYRNNTDYMFLGPQSGSSANGGAMALFGSTNVSGGNAGGVDFNVPNGQVRISHTNGSYVFRANSTSGYNATFELNDVGLQLGHNSASRAIVFNTASTERMRLTPAGDIGIGTTIPGGQFELSLNEGRKPGTGTWTLSSDKRLKTINGNYTKGLNEIVQLNPILFNYKNNGEHKFEQKVLDTEFPGFIAQEVQPLFPDAVGTDADGFLNFNIHPILIAYVNAFKELDIKTKELQRENKALNEKLNLQEEQLKSILARLSALERK